MGAISAGNTVVVKPSELAPACSSFLANTLPLYLDSKAVKVIEGGIDISQQVLKQKWDKIIFTGISSCWGSKQRINRDSSLILSSTARMIRITSRVFNCGIEYWYR